MRERGHQGRTTGLQAASEARERTAAARRIAFLSMDSHALGRRAEALLGEHLQAVLGDAAAVQCAVRSVQCAVGRLQLA